MNWFFWRKPKGLSQEEQQRLAEEEWTKWLIDNAGKSFIFGEMRAAMVRIKQQYPLWDRNPGGPAHAEYL